MSVEERWKDVEKQLSVPHRNRRIVVHKDEMRAAVRALVLEVHDAVCSICYQQTAFGRAACARRAQLEAQGKEG